MNKSEENEMSTAPPIAGRRKYFWNRDLSVEVDLLLFKLRGLLHALTVWNMKRQVRREITRLSRGRR